MQARLDERRFREGAPSRLDLRPSLLDDYECPLLYGGFYRVFRADGMGATWIDYLTVSEWMLDNDIPDWRREFVRDVFDAMHSEWRAVQRELDEKRKPKGRQ